MGPLTLHTDLPALRIVQAYLSALDSLDFGASEPSVWFADDAAFFDATNNTYHSAETIWNGIKTRFEGFEFVHHQTCIARVFGPDVRRLKEGERHVVSVQAIMLCRLKNWEEEKMIEIPRMFEFVVGMVEEPAPATSPDEGQDAGGPAGDPEARDIQEGNVESSLSQRRGYQGLHIYEGRVWWDSGVLAKAIEERQKEEERRRFRQIMTMSNGFLGQRPRQ
ncbi:hypothetical protein MPH_10577 [Macrophomina phaseolina MS6]|uniref:SnoaL-like domain-containing protein n=2 Tax=Macrophomina phaseolina TaxID=35725 RepID=K2RHA0_MACPH|nr:hypothetical protein MPH_10577 [Macrophomina phaseolina MS6]